MVGLVTHSNRLITNFSVTHSKQSITKKLSVPILDRNLCRWQQL